MNNEYIDVPKFINHLKDIIVDIVKKNKYKTNIEIDNCIIEVVTKELKEIDYLRDLSIIRELQIDTYLFNTYELHKDEDIETFLNRIAKEYLIEYLIDEYDIDEL